MASAYTAEQMDRYQQFISLPERFRRAQKPSLDIDFLTALQTHQMSAIPYENLSIHYSKSHQISLEPQQLYEKFLTKPGRGGYCMEVGIFYNHVLRFFGFQVYTAGARTRPRVNGIPQGEYLGWWVNVILWSDLFPSAGLYF